ncbi:MAG: radical SAM protein [Candidatus Firestonebacteria bacterium]
MKFLLVTSQNKNLVKLWACQETSHIGSLLPPVDLCSIAASLRKNEHIAKISDLRLFKNPLSTYSEELKSFKPDAIIINISTTSANYDYEIIKNTPKTVKKIAFGTHSIAMPEDCFNNGIDYILTGDPEVDIIDLIKNNFSSKMVSNYFKNLDELPFPALDLIDLEKYHTLYIKSERFSVLLGSRGCHYSCTYCLMPELFGNKIRLRSINNIVDEMQLDFEKYKITEFLFLDATFNINEERIYKLCEEILNRNLESLKWSCNMRVTPVSEKLLRMMKKAGCTRIYYGVEDIDLLEEVRKKITLAEIKNAFHLTKNAGIKTVAFIMLFPDTNNNEKSYVSKIVSLLKEIKTDSVQCNVAIPFPGTAMHKNFKTSLSNDWSTYDPNGEKLPYQSSIDLIKAKKDIYINFAILNPYIIIKTLFEVNLKDLFFMMKKFLIMLVEKFKTSS